MRASSLVQGAIEIMLLPASLRCKVYNKVSVGLTFIPRAIET